MNLEHIKQFFRLIFPIGRECPSEIIFFVTNKCNSMCKGCLYWSKLNNERFKDLSFDEIKKIFLPLTPAIPQNIK